MAKIGRGDPAIGGGVLGREGEYKSEEALCKFNGAMRDR